MAADDISRGRSSDRSVRDVVQKVTYVQGLHHGAMRLSNKECVLQDVRFGHNHLISLHRSISGRMWAQLHN